MSQILSYLWQVAMNPANPESVRAWARNEYNRLLPCR